MYYKVHGGHPRAGVIRIDELPRIDMAWLARRHSCQLAARPLVWTDPVAGNPK